ncbi:MAG: hypothetical protein ACI83O_000218 [Patescibacteria group bacterium]|jgi:hypothetical protein
MVATSVIVIGVLILVAMLALFLFAKKMMSMMIMGVILVVVVGLIVGVWYVIPIVSDTADYIDSGNLSGDAKEFAAEQADKAVSAGVDAAKNAVGLVGDDDELLDENDCFEFEVFTEEDGCYAECETDIDCAELDEKYDVAFTALEAIPLTESDCFEFEVWNAEDATCDLDCSDEAQCAAMDEEYFGGFDDYFDEDYTGESAAGSGFSGSDGDRVVFSIASDMSLELDSDNGNGNLRSRGEQEKIWRLYTTLIPQRMYDSYLVSYLVVSDGIDGTMAYVEQTQDNEVKWLISIDVYDVYDSDGEYIDREEFLSTLVHEFAHLLALNNDQVDVSVSVDDCGEYAHTGEGCPRDGSYWKAFDELYWSDADKDSANELYDAEEGETLYPGREDEFVSDYAGTNLGEDFAESFALFVLQDKPTGNTIKDQKVLFFYGYSELVTLRDEIRSNIKNVR